MTPAWKPAKNNTRHIGVACGILVILIILGYTIFDMSQNGYSDFESTIEEVRDDRGLDE